jgi:N-acetyl-gamma-glutamyl-phosphate reductase
MTPPKSINTVILGASGYTGAELLRLLHGHPNFRITALTGDSQAGKPIEAVYPHLRGRNLPALVKQTEVDFSDVALVFCCLPHGTTQEIIAGLPAHVQIVDLSADFRLKNLDEYAAWYGHAHRAPKLQKDAVYGLTEHARDAVKSARLLANPGCYPTCSLLPLIPLVEKNIIDPDCIIITAMSGISGAGRSAKQELLFTELDGGVSAYGIGHHRHVAEMEQALRAVNDESRIKNHDLRISFTPHLVPMSRGMLATIRVTLVNGKTVNDARTLLQKTYAGEPFVTVLAEGAPSTHQVRGTNQCVISVHQGRQSNEMIVVSAIDNLVKGASGQALQNANLMFGLPETTGLKLTALFP